MKTGSPAVRKQKRCKTETKNCASSVLKLSSIVDNMIYGINVFTIRVNIT